jgi:drug/metabolite transporter (DMT)-like permease
LNLASREKPALSCLIVKNCITRYVLCQAHPTFFGEIVSSLEKTNPEPKIPPLLGLAGGILAVSTASIFIRFAQGSAPSLVIAAYRLGLATLILAPWVLVRNVDEIRRISRKDLSLALLSGFFLALHFAAWITSLQFTTVSSSVVLVTTSSLWVALLSPLVLKERVILPVKIGLLVALLGGTIVSLSDICQIGSSGLDCSAFGNVLELRTFSGNMLALAGAWLAAGYLLIGRQLRARMSLPVYTFVVYGFAAFVLVILVIALRYPITGYPPMTYVWFLALAIIPQLLGHSTFNWALKYLPAAYVSISLLGEPVGSTILAFIFLSETPTFVKIIGAAFILSGILIASQGGLRRKKV